MASSSSGITRLLDLLKVVSRVERRSGFSSTLGIDYDFFRSLSESELDWNESTRTLTTVVPMTDRLVFPPTTKSPAGAGETAPTVGTLSTFQALIDDMTTWAFVLADPRRGRAGVSVTLSTEWAPSSLASSSRQQKKKDRPMSLQPPVIEIGDAVVIESKVNKVGTNVGFSTATVRTSAGEPVCFGSHVKFLPLGFVTDFLSSSVGWPLARLYAQHGVGGPRDADAPPPALARLFDSVELGGSESNHRATCSVTPHHASMGGPIHGGCQAVLMELVATRYLDRTRRGGGAYFLHSMDLEYVTKPSAKQVEITVQEILPHDDDSDADEKSPILPVQVILESRGRVNSYGMLRFLRRPER